jgi:hypothetical protein
MHFSRSCVNTIERHADRLRTGGQSIRIQSAWCSFVFDNFALIFFLPLSHLCLVLEPGERAAEEAERFTLQERSLVKKTKCLNTAAHDHKAAIFHCQS